MERRVALTESYMAESLKPVDRLRTLIQSRGVRKISPKCKFTKEPYLYLIAKGADDARNPSLDTLQDIVENGCGLTLSDFFHDPDAPGKDVALWDQFRACLSDDRRDLVELFLRSLERNWPKGVSRKRAVRSA